MGIEGHIADDLAHLVESELSDEGTVTPVDGAPAFSLRGIHRKPYQPALAGAEREIEAQGHRFIALASAASGVGRRDRLSLPAGEFAVINIEPTGFGLAVLPLEEL